MASYLLQCVQCSIDVEGHSTLRRYCSGRCRVRAFRARRAVASAFTRHAEAGAPVRVVSESDVPTTSLFLP